VARVALNPSFSEWGVAAGPGIVLGAYLIIFVFLAAGFYWLMQPTLAHKPGLPNTAVIQAKVPWVPPTPSEMPATVAIEGPAPQDVEGTVVAPKKDAVVAPKKKMKRREARTTPRRVLPRHRPNPFWDYASSPSYGYRRF
jgi:hypothetical protein